MPNSYYLHYRKELKRESTQLVEGPGFLSSKKQEAIRKVSVQTLLKEVVTANSSFYPDPNRCFRSQNRRMYLRSPNDQKEIQI